MGKQSVLQASVATAAACSWVLQDMQEQGACAAASHERSSKQVAVQAAAAAAAEAAACSQPLQYMQELVLAQLQAMTASVL
jgi:hypothetical protein